MEAIEFCNERTPAHKSYLIKRDNGSWRAASQSGIPMALSNYSPNGMAMEIALSRTTTMENALDVFKEHVYRQYREGARIV